MALPALWTGIFYDHRALSEAEALVDGWTHDEVSASRAAIAQLGVRASFRGRPLHELGSRLVEIAEGGLQRRALKRADGRDETVHLDPLKALVTRGRSPADELLERATSDDPLEVIKLTSPALTNAAINAGSLIPGRPSGSTPLATSTQKGRTARTASPTLSGRNPPASVSLRVLASSATSDQSNVLPVPPSAPSLFASASRYSPGYSAATATSSALPMRSAL